MGNDDHKERPDQPSSPPERPHMRRGWIVTAGLTALLGAALYLIYRLAPAAAMNWQELYAPRGWSGLLTDPTFLFGLWVFGAEALLAAILAQAGWQITVTDEEASKSNWVIFVLMAIGTILMEILSWVAFPAGPPGWLIILLLALASVAILLATAIWLWTWLWAAARRWVCSVLVPWHFAIFTWSIERFLECAEWGLRTYVECAQWAQRTYKECAAWGIHTYKECAKWGEQTTRKCGQWVERQSRECVQWGTESRKQCTSWLPSWLGWICYGWEIVVALVCLAYATVVSVVCVAWFLVVEVVCLLWVIVEELVCLAWFVVVVVVCLLWFVVVELVCLAFVVVTLVLAVIWAILMILVRLLFLC